MTRKAFQFWFATMAVLYGAFIVTGICLSVAESPFYTLFKDLLPLATALPLAILTSLYQRRTSFLQQLRSTWTLLVGAIQDAIQFAHAIEPKPEVASKLFRDLSVVIDDFRSLYRNLKEKPGEVGFYPFETLKTIQSELGAYYLSKSFSSEEERKRMRKTITSGWKIVRTAIVEEFDRLPPTHFDCPYIIPEKPNKARLDNRP